MGFSGLYAAFLEDIVTLEDEKEFTSNELSDKTETMSSSGIADDGHADVWEINDCDTDVGDTINEGDGSFHLCVL